MSEWVYLSYPLKERTPLYGNSGKLEFQRIRQIQNGDSSNNTELHFTAHSGTHMDAPYHFDDNGKSLDEYPASNWIFNHPWFLSLPTKTATILEFLMLEHELEAIPMETDLLLIKTGYASFRNSNDSLEREKYISQGPGISPDIGNWLRKLNNVRAIGFDFISLTSYQHREIGRKAHQCFLGDGEGDPILIIEDMNLDPLQTKPIKVFSIPMLYEKADGAPTTIIAKI